MRKPALPLLHSSLLLARFLSRAAVFCVALAGASTSLAAPATPPAKPNVLFICVDDLKPLLGCYGDPVAKTPNVDRLAARAVRFKAAYCNQAVCAPSRNALMTGLRPTTLGVYDLPTFFRKAAPDAVTVAQYFKQNGWRTEALGKIFHVGHGNTEDPASWTVPHWRPQVQNQYALAQNRPPPAAVDAATVDPAQAPRGAATECADVPDSTYADGLIAEEAIRRLRAASERRGQPFFLAVGFLKPHLPFVAPKKYWDLYSRDLFQPHPRQTPPDGAPSFAPTPWGELRNYSDIPRLGPLSPDQQRQLIHGYYAATSYMDAQLGRVLQELHRLGLDDNTIILFWGDHGWHLGDHGMWCKHTNYEEATRIPLLVAAPAIPKGKVCSALVESVDLYPTLCELAGLPVPKGLDGRSFLAALKHPASAKTKDAVFHVYPRSPQGIGPLLGRAVRTARYRLVEWKRPGALPDTAILELYDYETDPGETQNLAGSKPQVVAQLRAILAKQPEAKPQLTTPAVVPKKKKARKV